MVASIIDTGLFTSLGFQLQDIGSGFVSGWVSTNIGFSRTHGGRFDGRSSGKTGKIRQTLKVAPAMGIDVTDRLWEIGDIVKPVEQAQQPGPRYPYKKRAEDSNWATTR